MNKIISYLAVVFLCTSSALAADVTFITDPGIGHEAAIKKAEANLGLLLTEINRAQKAGVPVSLRDMAMDDFSKKSLAGIWAVTPFYCDDEELVERLWVFKDGSMMCNHIPLVITPQEETFGMGTYQEAVVEFDSKGGITDFRFSLDAQMTESMEKCGSVVEREKQMIILQYLERFRTAYNQKDINTIDQLFSDDALIITGKVVNTKGIGDDATLRAKVEFNRQSKDQYLNNLKRAFLRNKWINVTFSQIGENGEETKGCAGITRSNIDPTKYGVRLHQSWRSSTYSDDGYLFLLWEFPEDGKSPVIHVRTWQPEWLDKQKTQKAEINDDMSTLGGFGL